MKNFTSLPLKVLALLSISCTTLVAQDWREPLADPYVSFYDVQADFYQDWGVKEAQNNQHRADIAEAADKFAVGHHAITPAPYMKGGYKQFKRWEWFMEPRVFPSGDMTLVSQTYERFTDYVQTNADAQWQFERSLPGGANRVGGPPNQALSSTWTFSGPTGAPTGAGAGRINFIRFDPTNSNTIWAGAPAGGLWKSTNSGGTWTTNTDFLTVIGCTDVAIDPLNTQNMYLASGDGDAGDTYSIGVLKSTDGGVTWNTTGLTWTVNQGRTISKLLIHPTNPQIVMAFTSNGIYRTTNGGTAWTQVQTTNSFKDAEYKPGDPTTVYASGTRFWKSTDSGVTWTNTATGLPANTAVDRFAIAVTQDPTGTDYVYVLAGSAANDGFYGLYRSTDSGVTFTTRSTTPNILGWATAGNDTGGQGWYDLAIAASPTSRDVVVTGGVNIWRSTNGGTNWTLNAHWTGSGAPYSHADVHDIVFLPGNGTTYFSGCDGGVFRTTNSGGAWTDLSSNLCIAQIYRIGQSASNATLYITGHQDNGTNLKNGASYTGTMGGDGMDCFIDRTNNNVMYGSQYSGSLNRTTNGGANWTGINTGLSGTAPWVTSWYQDPTTANTIYCGRTNLFRSTNQGTNWAAVASAVPGTGTIVDFRIAQSNNQIIYVVKSNAVYKTINAGAAWTTITGTLPVGSAAITRVDVKPTDPNTVVVTFSGYSSGNKCFRSTNGGTSWTNISTGLPNLPTNCVRFSPGMTNDAMYVGCDVGVYYMDNTFTSWQPYFTALPNVPIFDLEVYQPTGKLRASSYGRGVWEVDIYNPGTLAPIADFTANYTTICPGTPVNFTDMSSFTPTSWAWTFQGGTPATSTVQNPTGITWSVAGTYSVSLVATNVNGNDTEIKTTYITVLPSATAPPLAEGFVSTTFLPTNWTPNNINNDGIYWDRSATAGVAPTAGNSARFDNYNLDAAGARDEMWCPRQSLATMATCSLTFDVSYARYDVTYSDTLEVMVSSNCGVTWTQVWIKGGTTLATVPDQTTQFTPTTAQWRNENISLNSYCGQASVLVKFVNHGRYGNCLYVDNVNIAGTVAAAMPNGVFTASATSVCAGTPVSFTDASNNTPTSWTWTFPSGTPASATTQNVGSVVWNTAGTYTVTHTATNVNGTGTTTQTITVLATPTVTATASSTTICNGASTTLTGAGASTYAWMPGPLSGSPVTVSPTTTTTYTVTGTAANGCTSTGIRLITVNPSPTVTATAGSPTICSGNSTTLTGGGGSTYLWMPGSLTGSPVTVTPAGTTTYTVTGTAVNGCTATQTVLVTVNPTPTVNATAGSPTICTGGTSSLTGSGASTYNWMPGSLSGTTVSVSPATTTTYTVTGTAANGCTATQTVMVTVTPSPTVGVSASSTTICSGSSTTITASGATTYTWMPGALSGTSVVVSPTITTTYTVTGTTGCTDTETIVITVNPSPTVTAVAGSPTICSGNSSSLTGTGASTYLWMPGSLTGSPVTVSPATTTTYTMTGTAANGCSTTQTVLVTVNPSPTVTPTATNSSICTGGSTTLSATGASTYLWMPGSLSGSSVVVTPVATTTYTVTGTAANGCTNVQTITITVGAQPTVTASASSNSVCLGSSTTLTGGGTTSYTWMPGSLSGTSVVVSPTTTTTYTVTGSNGPGCTNTATILITVNAIPNVTASGSPTTICAGSSTTLTGSGGVTYTWMPGAVSGSPIVVSPAATTTYTVTGTDANGCTDTGTRLITVNAAPTLTVTPASPSICPGGSVTLVGTTSANHTYSWSPTVGLSAPTSATTVASPTVTTTYVLTKTRTSTGCTITRTVVVTVNPSPTITATAGSPTICAGGTTTLSGSGASTYAWMPGSLSGTTVNVSPVTTTTYTVTGTSAQGCTSTQTVVVTIGPPPTTTASASGAICVGDSATLTGSGAATYTWMPGSLSGTTVNVSPGSTTTYTVTGSNGVGCTSTTTVAVTVNSLPNVTASAPGTTICTGDFVTLTGSGAATYDWMPGSLNGSPVTDSPTASVTYTVTGTDANGCSSTGTLTVTVNSLPVVTVTLPTDTFCAIDGPTALSGGSPAGGMFSGPGVSSNAFDASSVGLGTYSIMYTYTDANGCADSAAQTVVVDVCNSIVDTNNVSLIMVMPNPSNGEFVLSFFVQKQDNYVLEVHNVLGEIVYTEELQNFSGAFATKINLSEQGRGAYTVRLRSTTEEVVIRVLTQ